MRTLFRLLIVSALLLALPSADHPMHLASHELRAKNHILTSFTDKGAIIAAIKSR